MKISVIGIGPGDAMYLTPQARKAILEADVVVGYGLYVDLVASLTQGKEIISSGMRQEVERCRRALECARSGKKVALVCSGDAGIYGLAGVVIELVGEEREISVDVIPGITAASSVAALLGAPLVNDFSVVSLSDLLTPWETIERRLRLASEADFVLCLYNPRSKTRQEHLNRAVRILLEYREPGTPCGYVKNVGREGQQVRVCTLGTLDIEDVDMFTTVIVGNSRTERIGDKMVTPRGYREL